MLSAIALAIEPNPPKWDSRVKIITPDDNCQNIVNSINTGNGDTWSDSRYALLFTEGYHNCSINVQ
jgi:hypothetical protein